MNDNDRKNLKKTIEEIKKLFIEIWKPQYGVTGNENDIKISVIDKNQREDYINTTQKNSKRDIKV